MDASSLRCPHCGAAADPAAQRCQYCKARLATISCPSCLALMFDSSTFCPSCGARRSRTEQPALVRCPACRTKMTQVDLGDTTLLECATCDGVWVDAETFERICATRETQAAVLHHARQEGRPVERQVRYRPCARCGTMMNRVNFAKVSGTVIDVCKNHGTFLDRGELQSLVQFIQGGGLERARQRQLEDLKEQENRLREQERRLGTKAPGGLDYGVPPGERAVTAFGQFLDFGTIINLFSDS